ncbi:MAG: GYD domain-containing protein [Acidobacteriaceae bacterium]
MATYLMQYSYKPETWAGFIKNPTNRREAVDKVITQLGGKLIGCWFGFGEHDMFVLTEGPDPINVAAGSMLVSASGAFTNIKTTVLLTMEEGVSAMQKAGTMSYTPPTR